jgi:hypothetical protein
MQQQYLELRTRRELGTILSDSFAFVRLNVKPLFNVLLKTTGVFFLISVLLSGLYQYASAAVWVTTDPLYFFIVLMLMLLGSILFFTSAAAAVYSYMENYMTNKGDIQEDVIIQETRSKIAQLILLGLISYFLMVIGILFFIIPGFYFLVPITLIFPIFCFQGLGKRDSIKAAFKLTSGYWWVTFGTLFVVGLVVGIISFVFQLPGSVYLGGKTFFAISEGSEAFSGDFIYLILATIGSAASSLLSIILIIAIGLVYFDLDEERNRTGLKAKLDDLG